MDVQEVRDRVDAIIAVTWDDPESMHGSEDALMVDVLRAVAEGHPDAARLAAETLRAVAREDVIRWYA